MVRFGPYLWKTMDSLGGKRRKRDKSNTNRFGHASERSEFTSYNGKRVECR